MSTTFNITNTGNHGTTVMGNDSKVIVQHSPQQPSGNVQPTARTSRDGKSGNLSKIIEKGYVLIINNEVFNNPYLNREGSNFDVDNLKSMFEGFGLQVEDIENLTATEMEEKLQITSEKDFSQYDCFICIILSHGSSDGILGIDENVIPVEDITSKFRLPSFKNMPKIFLFQACQGPKEDIIADSTNDDGPIPLTYTSLPSDANFLICYASSPDMKCYREESVGSWFMQSIVAVFTEYAAEEHIMDMMIRVNDEVSQKCTTKGYKQMPSEVCMLTKKFYFKSQS